MTTKTPPLLAWHNRAALRTKILNRVLAHQKADEIVSGKSWNGHQGCSAGCALHHDSPHSVCEEMVGFPRTLFRLNDRLFEAIHAFKPETAKAWPHRFYSAARKGADLTLVWPRFAHWMLVDPETGVIRHTKREQTRKAIEQVAALFADWIKTGVKPNFSDAAAVAADAADAADADAAAADAAVAAVAAAVAAAAAAAADADAADADAADADAADADAAAAAADARREFYRRHGYWPRYWYYNRGWGINYPKGQARYLAMADKLIELMKSV